MSNDESTTALEREIEETRERLASTIDLLMHRASPKTIANRQVSAIKAVYVEPGTGQPRTDNILKTVGVLVGTVVVLTLIRKAVS